MHLVEHHKREGNPLNEKIRIAANDRDPNAGNMSHEYRLSWPSSGAHSPHALPKIAGADLVIRFQQGSIAEGGINGASNEALAAIIIDRLEGAQQGSHACEENEDALYYFAKGLAKLHSRSRRRMQAGIADTSKVDASETAFQQERDEHAQGQQQLGEGTANTGGEQSTPAAQQPIVPEVNPTPAAQQPAELATQAEQPSEQAPADPHAPTEPPAAEQPAEQSQPSEQAAEQAQPENTTPAS
jgi:hypothetical protein